MVVGVALGQRHHATLLLHNAPNYHSTFHLREDTMMSTCTSVYER